MKAEATINYEMLDDLYREWQKTKGGTAGDLQLMTAKAVAEVSFKAGQKNPETTVSTVLGYEAGQEAEKAHWIKEIESQVHNAYEGGKEEERKKWIKEAMKAGILIAKPKEQAGIAEEFRLQGRKEVAEWIKANANLERGDCDVGLCFEDYLHFDYHDWRVKLKGWGIE